MYLTATAVQWFDPALEVTVSIVCPGALVPAASCRDGYVLPIGSYGALPLWFLMEARVDGSYLLTHGGSHNRSLW